MRRCFWGRDVHSRDFNNYFDDLDNLEDLRINLEESEILKQRETSIRPPK
jgi:hypothetical protein